MALSMNVERLWSLPDGTICLLVERADAPCFEICVVRAEEVLRQSRLYARGSALTLAEAWRCTRASVHAQRVAEAAVARVAATNASNMR